MMSYDNQISSHLDFLRAEGLDVDSLELGKMVRCHTAGKIEGRGNLAYRTMYNEMDKGYCGLVTWCRNADGKEKSHKTYGRKLINFDDGDFLASRKRADIKNKSENIDQIEQDEQEKAAKKAYLFWEYSSTTGTSDYLVSKGVGCYGIRFRSTKAYGNTAVVPMRDRDGKLWGYQLLNPDGSKIMAKGSRTKSLFHELNLITNGKRFGVAESYVTAATCLELSGLPMVCSFSSENMVATVKELSQKYPKSEIILFPDNDRHLELRGLPNKGVLSAIETINCVKQCGCMAKPFFCDSMPFKEASDWNDLVRIEGRQVAKDQMMEKLKSYL